MEAIADFVDVKSPFTIGHSRTVADLAAAERVRLYPNVIERMLRFSGPLAPLVRISVQHHERLEGSGYPRGLAGDATWLLGAIGVVAGPLGPLREQERLGDCMLPQLGMFFTDGVAAFNPA